MEGRKIQILVFCLLLIGPNGLISQVSFPSYNLPLLVVNTDGLIIPDEPKIMVRFKVIDNGAGQSNKPEDVPNGYDGWIGIEKRGQSSQFFFEKVGYGFETRLADGSNNNVELLGMPKENDWVLHGPFSDKTLMRNAMAYEIGRKLMDYAPRSRFVELIINSDYKGVYLLVEKIKRDANRVDIAKLKPTDNSGDQLTGGYILRIDKTQPEEGFYSDHPPPNNRANQQILFAYHYPKVDEITSSQKSYIKNWMADFEDALKASTFKDPGLGYPAYIDESSFVNYFLINELTRNPDAYRISTYMYKDRDSLGGKLHMGPIWDYNLGFGNVNFCIGPSPIGWVKDYNYTCPEDRWLIPFWWDRLLQDTAFSRQVRDRWQELRQNELSDVNVLGLTASMQLELANAVERNFIRWPVLSEGIWPNPEVRDTYGNEMDAFRQWLQDRMAWMDDAVINLAQPIYNIDDFFEPILFPNPSAGEIKLKFYAPASQKVTIRIYDSIGRQVKQVVSNDHLTGENIISLGQSFVVQGTYFYSVWYDFVFKSAGSFQCQRSL